MTAAPPIGPAGFALDLEFPPAAMRLVLRVLGAKDGRAAAMARSWHDTAERSLAGAGLALVEGTRPARWRLERVLAEDGIARPAGVPAAVLATAGRLDGLGHPLPDALVPLCRLEARRRRVTSGEVTADVLAGVLHAAVELPVGRVLLTGPRAAVGALAADLADKAGAMVAPCALSALALELAGQALPAPRLGPPVLPDLPSVGAAFAHVCGQLAGVIRHFAPLAAESSGGEPVHQMRVAVRRLRSAIKLFAPTVGDPQLDAAAAELRALGQVLGPARDWDVFLDGAGHAVAAAFAEDKRVVRLVRAAARRRAAHYADLHGYLTGAAFRRLGIALAMCALAPMPADDDLRAFAAASLAKRWRRLRAPGAAIAALPDAELHKIRLRAKRLRYCAEIFLPLYGRREAEKFIRRVTTLQDRLGRLNDTTVAAGLLAELGPTGRGFAGGAVAGLVNAHGQGARAEIAGAWRKLRKTALFWT